jgi:hypothetical protein
MIRARIRRRQPGYKTSHAPPWKWGENLRIILGFTNVLLQSSSPVAMDYSPSPIPVDGGGLPIVFWWVVNDYFRFRPRTGSPPGILEVRLWTQVSCGLFTGMTDETAVLAPGQRAEGGPDGIPQEPGKRHCPLGAPGSSLAGRLDVPGHARLQPGRTARCPARDRRVVLGPNGQPAECNSAIPGGGPMPRWSVAVPGEARHRECSERS